MSDRRMLGKVATCLAAWLVAWPTAAPAVAEELHPPIPVPFELKEPGYVTLVIERPDGTRVRNLVSETPFPAGKNVAWWDGLDDLGRDVDAAKHSVYNVPGRPVEPGAYRARGLVRPELKLAYQLTPYNPGNPPWRTADLSHGWLANHTPPSAVLWVPAGAAPNRADEAPDAKGWNGAPLARADKSRAPYDGPQVLVASHVSEGGSGLAWLDRDGRKLHGQMWLGGVWTAASQLARDTGKNPVPGVYAYAAAFWPGDKYNKNVAEIRLHELVSRQDPTKPKDTRFGRGDDRPVLSPHYRLPNAPQGRDNFDMTTAERDGLRGMAVRDGLIVMSANSIDRLVFVDAREKKVVGLAALDDPRGVEFQADSRLLALSGTRLIRMSLPTIAGPADFDVSSDKPTVALPEEEVLVASGLADPQQVALDHDGNVYVSDWGDSHQVKVFSRDGKPVRAIGVAGKPAIGPYDANRMRHPNGLTIDDRGRLWVAETDKAPKRVSVWDATTGAIVDAFYGPAKYGGGGNIDPVDPTRFFYVDDGGGMEFAIDWEAGTDRVTSVYWRPDVNDFPIRGKWVGAGPQTPIHFNGQIYLTDAYSTSATEGVRAASLWTLRDGIARPVAAVGNIQDAARKVFPIFKTEPYLARMPAKTDVDKAELMFVWSDRDEDGRMSADETTFVRPPAETVSGQRLIEGVTVQADLSFAVAVFGDAAINLRPQSFTAGGVPLYDFDKREVIATNVNRKASSGHGQILVGDGGWSVLTTPPKPYSPYGLGGVKDGKPMWSYPSMWPGLHASHIAPMPPQPGTLIGTTRLLGTPFSMPENDLWPIWAIAGNKGQIYLFTTDGLFVATLFNDSRAGEPWPAQESRDADVTHVTLNEECFGPMVTRLADGRVIVQGGFNSSLVRLDGLTGARRLPAVDVNVSNDQLVAAQDYFIRREAARQAGKGPAELVVRVGPDSTAPTLDGQFDDWAAASWVTIDQRTKKVGNFGKQPAKTEAALMVAGDRLYGAVRADDENLLNNSGESLQNVFKTGGAIDLMIGADPSAPADRKSAAPGDQRLVITRVKGKPVAVLYEQVVRGWTGPTVEFTSPVRSVRFAKVADVSDRVRLAIGSEDGPNKAFKYGLYEFSIPLADLRLAPKPGAELRGDVGILRGNGYETTQRVYWTNKATGLVSDLPSEAELRPSLWGQLLFQAAANN